MTFIKVRGRLQKNILPQRTVAQHASNVLSSGQLNTCNMLNMCNTLNTVWHHTCYSNLSQTAISLHSSELPRSLREITLYIRIWELLPSSFWKIVMFQYSGIHYGTWAGIPRLYGAFRSMNVFVWVDCDRTPGRWSLLLFWKNNRYDHSCLSCSSSARKNKILDVF